MKEKNYVINSKVSMSERHEIPSKRLTLKEEDPQSEK